MFMHTALKLLPKEAAKAKDQGFVTSMQLFKSLWCEFTPLFKEHDSLEIEFGDDAGTWCWTPGGTNADDSAPIGVPFVHVTIASLMHESNQHEAMIVVDNMFSKFEELLINTDLSEQDFRIESSAHVDPSSVLDIVNY